MWVRMTGASAGSKLDVIADGHIMDNSVIANHTDFNGHVGTNQRWWNDGYSGSGNLRTNILTFTDAALSKYKKVEAEIIFRDYQSTSGIWEESYVYCGNNEVAYKKWITDFPSTRDNDQFFNFESAIGNIDVRTRDYSGSMNASDVYYIINKLILYK